jgi:hypothetical protein
MVDQDTINLEATKLAVGLAKDLSVQLLTLSSALMGLTVVLVKDLLRPNTVFKMFLAFAVIGAYLISIICGLYALMRLTGSLAPVTGPVALSLDAARGGAACQIYAFGFATLLFLIYSGKAIVALWWNPPAQN